MKTVIIDRSHASNGVAMVQLNRPDRLNAFNEAMRADFVAAIQACNEDEDCRVVVVRGAGRAFSVGADVSSPAPHRSPAADARHLVEHSLGPFFEAWDSPKPVIAQVHGYCLGIATILCNLCDLVFVSEDAQIGWPGLPLGGGFISPTWAWYVNLHKAKELSYQPGSGVDGAEAARLGFANAAVPEAELPAAVLEHAVRIARVPADILAIKKAALNGVFDRLGFREAIERGATWNALAHSTEGAGEARSLIAELGPKQAAAHYTAPADAADPNSSADPG